MKNSKNEKVCQFAKKNQFGQILSKKHINNRRLQCIGPLKRELWLGCGHQRGAYHMQAHLL